MSFFDLSSWIEHKTHYISDKIFYFYLGFKTARFI